MTPHWARRPPSTGHGRLGAPSNRQPVLGLVNVCPTDLLAVVGCAVSTLVHCAQRTE